MFRKEAIESRRMKWSGRALLLPGMPAWLITGFCMLFIVSFVVFIIAGNYTRRVNVTGEVTTNPRAVRVYSGVQGFVVKSYVKEGDSVRKGDPVYEIDISRTTSSGVVSENQRNDIEDQIKRVSDIVVRLRDSKNATLESLEKQKAQYTDAYSQSSGIIKRAQEGISIMKKNMDNYRHYQQKGLINRDQLTNQIALYYQQHNNLLTLSAQNEQNALQVTALENQLQIQSAEFDSRIYQMELQKYELQKELINADAGGESIIRSLSDGKIDSLSVTNGQMVNVGDSLLQIIPDAIKNYYLVIWVPNESIPYINVGDNVNLRYDAFPYEKFGQFKGTIELISRTPATIQEMSTYQVYPDIQTTSTPHYKVIVRPESERITYNGKTLNLENGMKVESTLFLEKRKIYQWMFSPFYEMQRSASGQVND